MRPARPDRTLPRGGRATRPSRSTRSARSRSPDASPRRPSTTSSTTRHVADPVEPDQRRGAVPRPATDTVGSSHRSRSARGGDRRHGRHRRALTAGARPHHRRGHRPDGGARAPADVIDRSSSSPPTGIAADEATRIRSPHRRTLNGACDRRSTSSSRPSAPGDGDRRASPSRGAAPAAQPRAGSSRRPRPHPRASTQRDDRRTGRAVPPRRRLAEHQVDVGADVRREVDLVDHEQVGERHARAALARHLVAAGDVDHEDLHVDEAAAEDRGEVVAAALDERDVDAAVLRLESLDGVEVGGDVVADRGVRAAARSRPRRSARPAARRRGASASASSVVKMSLVTTTSDSSSRSNRHSAPTSVGLAAADRPADADPQAPGRAPVAGAAGAWSWTGRRARIVRDVMRWHGLRAVACGRAVRRRRAGRPRPPWSLAEDLGRAAAGRAGRSDGERVDRSRAARRATRVDHRRRAAAWTTPRASIGSRPSRRTAADVTAAREMVEARARPRRPASPPAAATTAPSAIGWCGPSGVADTASTPALGQMRPAGAQQLAPEPAARRRGASATASAARVLVVELGRRSAGASRGRRRAARAAANAASTSPVVASRPSQVRARSDGARRRTSPSATAASTPAECAWPPAGNRPSASSSSAAVHRRHQNRK